MASPSASNGSNARSSGPPGRRRNRDAIERPTRASRTSRVDGRSPARPRPLGTGSSRSCSRRSTAGCIVLLVFVRFLIGWALLAVAFGVTSWLLSGMEVSGGVWGYIWVSALFGIVNAILGTIIRLFTLPLILITFGLFAVLVNALLLQITDALSSHLTIDEFWWTAIWAAIILAFVSVILSVAFRALVWHERPAVT